MNSVGKVVETLVLGKTKSVFLALSLGLALGVAGGQLLHCDAETNKKAAATENDQAQIPVHVHAGKATGSKRVSDLDSTINGMRESASALSLPSSMFEPWWRTMLRDPDASWIMRNFDVISSDPDRSWNFPVGLGSYIPRLDTTENNDVIRIFAEVPGIEEKDLDVTVTDDAVTVKGDKKVDFNSPDSKQAKGLQTIERAYGSFERTISLPCRVESDKAEATLKNGVLTITMPKSHAIQTQSKKLSIRRE